MRDRKQQLDDKDHRFARAIFVEIMKFIAYFGIVFILLEYTLAVDDVYVDEDDKCVYIVEVPAFQEPIMHENCEEYTPKGRYNKKIVRNRD